MQLKYDFYKKNLTTNAEHRIKKQIAIAEISIATYMQANEVEALLEAGEEFETDNYKYWAEEAMKY